MIFIRRFPFSIATEHEPEFNGAFRRPGPSRLIFLNLLWSLGLYFSLVENTLDTNNILLDFTSRTYNPILKHAENISSDKCNKQNPWRTRDEVVFKAYDSTNPTSPASTPVVIKADIARNATMRMIIAPTNSNRTDNHRLTDMLGR